MTGIGWLIVHAMRRDPTAATALFSARTLLVQAGVLSPPDRRREMVLLGIAAGAAVLTILLGNLILQPQVTAMRERLGFDHQYQQPGQFNPDWINQQGPGGKPAK